MAAGERPAPGGFLKRLSGRLSMTTAEIDAHELRADTERRGATAIGELPDRCVATVSGTIRSIIVRPTDDVPALVAELYDGSVPLNLVWLGRHEIRGIRPGVHLEARGRVTVHRGVPTIFNPSYEIVLSRAE